MKNRSLFKYISINPETQSSLSCLNKTNLVNSLNRLLSIILFSVQNSHALFGLIPFFFAIYVFSIIPSFTLAREANDIEVILENGKSESDLVQKIKTRTYPGGVDESDLRVLIQLNKPQRKISPTAEDIHDDGSSVGSAQD